MFDVFRSQRKSIKYLLTFLLGMVGLSMVITLVPGLFSTPMTDLNDPVLVEIGDERITINDVQAQLNQMIRPGQDASQIMGLLAGQAIDSLITERVLLTEADRLGLKPNDRQLAEWIRDQIPALFQNGQFNSAQYQAMVQQQFGLSIPAFEKRLLTDLTVQGRLQSMITDSVVVTESEVRSAFTERNEQAQVEYVPILSSGFRNEVDASEAKVLEFFSSNQFRYRTQETRSIKYINFVPQPAPPGSEISDAEIRTFYDQNQYRFETQDRVNPRHILFMTINPDTGAALSDAEKAAKKALAEEVLAKVRAGGDFAALAAQYSEDPGTKEDGGDLGWVVAGQIGTPLFETATFALQPNEVSDVIEAEYGYHIIQMQARESATRKPLEDVREEIIGDLRAERGMSAQQEQVDQALASLRNATPETVDAVAAELGFPVTTMSDFEQGRSPSQLARTPQLLRSVFNGSLGELIPHADATGMVAVMITAINVPRDMTFEESAERARLDYINAETRSLAEAKAAELLEKAKTSSLAAAAAALGYQVEQSELFTRAGQVAGFTIAESLPDAFTAPLGEPQGPVSITGGFGVYVPLNRVEPDMSSFAMQSASIRQQLTEARRAEAFEIFRDAVLTRYSQEGKIRRYEARIQQFLELAARPL